MTKRRTDWEHCSTMSTKAAGDQASNKHVIILLHTSVPNSEWLFNYSCNAVCCMFILLPYVSPLQMLWFIQLSRLDKMSFVHTTNRRTCAHALLKFMMFVLWCKDDHVIALRRICSALGKNVWFSPQTWVVVFWLRETCWAKLWKAFRSPVDVKVLKKWTF